MGVSVRHALQLAGLAAALGLAALTAPAVAAADDGTGEPAPGVSSSGSIAAADDAAPPANADSQTNTTLGNGRTPGDSKTSKTPYDATGGKPGMPATSSLSQISSGMGGISSGMSQSESSQKQAEADEIQEMATLLQSAQNRDAEFMAEMQDMVDGIRLQMAEIAENSSTSRPTTRG
jgi:hypothetical protein